MVTSNLIAWNELMIKSHLSHVHPISQTGLIIVRLTSHADPLSQEWRSLQRWFKMVRLTIH